jgi:DNA invertase Pin-like site-specific DNA recombinase
VATYGYLRADAAADDNAVRRAAAALAAKADALDGPPAAVYTGGNGSAAELAAVLQAGDTLIVQQLADLGTSMPDLTKTLKALCGQGVRLYAAGGTGSDLDLPPEAGDTLLKIVSLWRTTERAIRSRRSRETALARKQQGLAVGYPPMGKRVVRRQGVARLEWDQRQLRHIAEIARRVPAEGVAAVAKDFWRREIKDRRGRPWGKQRPKPFSLYRTPYQSFYRAVRWFHRMKRKGLLPAPYDGLAASIPEPKTFRAEPRPKGWARGGTARREEERAERRAQTHAAQQERCRKEKEARLAARVHKPVVARLGAARKHPRLEELGA